MAAAEGPTAGHAPSPPARKKGRRGDAARISWPVWGVMFGGFGLIQEFIDRSSAPSLRFWWLQWVLAALSVPLLLIGLLFLAAGVNMARRELGLGRS